MPTSSLKGTTSETLVIASSRAGVVGWLLPLWLMSIAIGALLLRNFGSAHGNELPLDRAVFLATSAATLTGFQGVGMDTLLPAGRIFIFMLNFVGGFFALAVGGELVARAVGASHSSKRIVLGSLVMLVLAVVLGAPALYSTQRGAIGAMQLALAVVTNSGIAWTAPPSVDSAQVQLVVLPFAIFGGLGIVVMLDLFDCMTKRQKLSRFSSAVLSATAAIYLFGFVLIGLLDWFDTSRPNWGKILISSSAASINARSMGLPIERLDSLPKSTWWFSLILSMIGTAPGSAGGGVSVLAPFILASGVWNALRGRIATRTFGIASVIVVVYAIFTSGVFIALSATVDRVGDDRLLMYAMGAVSTVGLSPEQVSLVGPPLGILSVAMVFGRLAPLGALWWLSMGSKSRQTVLPFGPSTDPLS